ncbi:glycosyltransferase [Neokomagataea thailandica]|uniref:Glycosyltransferase n=1 Tax=Neokomagataea tanensis NBRC 106556 TaxID=1223519 RepID=A0ABQ0QJW8_9PROT|nr:MULTISPECIES: glycosyltransferase [Neokomagataea]GBR47472.1 glycosyltransferase [Neokomagataea tanensis NBRC 106556]
MLRTGSALTSLGAWVYLGMFHGRFWQSGPLLEPRDTPSSAPDVAIVVPARDEAESVKACLKSLLAQDYNGTLSVILVDDNSTDGTGDLARSVPDPKKRLTVLTGENRPAGWSGKLWAVHQGVQHALTNIGPHGYILLTDADILHARTHVASLVSKARDDNLDLVSEMVALNCESQAERFLVPAFVYFFAMLYPFSRTADPSSRVAGAAGGTILLRRRALERIGGIETLKGALIDDCTLAAHVKRSGGRLYLGHSAQAWSIRPYQGAHDVWKMIARTAYVQLRYSPLLLVGTVIGMGFVWLLPIFYAVFAKGRPRKIGLLTYLISCATFLPTLRRFELPLWRALPLPLVAAFYMAATIGSAINHHRGTGVQWKERAYKDDAA